MPKVRSLTQRVLSVLAAMALTFQVLVPVGFMPASVADGWYIEFCPDGLPTPTLVALYGAHHAHHGAVHHAHPGVEGSTEFYQCDYGAGAGSGGLLVHRSPLYPGLCLPVKEFPKPPGGVAFDHALRGFWCRAPPSSVRFS